MTSPTEPNRTARSHRRQIIWGLVMVAGLVGGLIFIGMFPPNQYPFYPKCFLHEATGLHCPGCGLTRSTHALVSGDVVQAVAYNPLLLLVAGYFSVLVILNLVRYWQQRPVWSPPQWFAWLILCVICAFGVLRNVPYYPLTMLAPHERR